METSGEKIEFILNSVFLKCFASFSRNLFKKKTFQSKFTDKGCPLGLNLINSNKILLVY